MRRSLVVVLVAFSLTGCARYVWTKAAFTEQEFNRDSYECEKDARQSGYFGTGLAGALNMREFNDRCMVARGWYKVKE
jgi:hypothetical protein